MGTKIRMPSIFRRAILNIQETRRNIEEISTEVNSEVPIEGDEENVVRIRCNAKVNLVKGTTRLDKKTCKGEIVKKKKGDEDTDGD